jgi:hypothetical protein
MGMVELTARESKLTAAIYAGRGAVKRPREGRLPGGFVRLVEPE